MTTSNRIGALRVQLSERRSYRECEFRQKQSDATAVRARGFHHGVHGDARAALELAGFVFDSTPLEFSDDEFRDFAWEALLCTIPASAPY
jgi:hypothetical protein